MGKIVYLMLGNGVTIDFIKHIKKAEEIDVINLFRYGANVLWPANGEPGFLSFKRCPNLWNLGARPTMSSQEAIILLEDIITCMNVYMSTPEEHRKPRPSNEIYIQAHRELTKYLKHLFVCYNDRARELPAEAGGWRWGRYIKKLNEDAAIDRVYIVTFNYDVWLERLLRLLNVPFCLTLLEPGGASKIEVLKPHGSISFCHRTELGQSAFVISNSSDVVDSNIEDFLVRYDQLNANYVADALIPPAGDAGRLRSSWAGQIREQARRWIKELRRGDELIISGLSYWHVDRSEIDELLVVCDREVDVRMINPAPSRAMTAVLTSLFDTFTLYPDAEVLGELQK